MSLLFAFTSVSDLDVTGDTSVTRSSSSMAPGVSECIRTSTTGAAGHGKMSLPQELPSTFWFSFYVSISNNNNNSTPGFVLTDLDGAPLIRIQKELSGTGSASLFLTNEAGVPVEFVAWPVVTTSGVWRFDIYFSLIEDGEVLIYINKNLEHSYSGDFRLPPNKKIREIILGRISGTSYNYYSALFGATVPTVDCDFVQRIPEGIGAAAEWDGGLAAVNSTDLNDHILLTARDGTARSSFTLPPFEDAERTVLGIVNSLRVRSGPTTVDEVGTYLRIDNNDIDFPAVRRGQFLAPDLTPYSINPATGNPFTAEELSGAEIGIRVA